MTVTTAPAPAASQPSTSQSNPSHPRGFSTTRPEDFSEFQTPKNSSDPQHRPNYILTLHTDKAHQSSMNELRRIYFPPKLNKLDAHITLFHALPGAKLEDSVVPAIEDMVSKTAPYRIRATGPFRLKNGIGISVLDDIEHANKGKHGRNMTRIIHAELRKQWGEWLSDQDARPVRVHYTVMNKVTHEPVIDRAMAELEETFKQGFDVTGGKFDHKDHTSTEPNKAEQGTEEAAERLTLEARVHGLTLWRYDKNGTWQDPVQFDFQR